MSDDGGAERQFGLPSPSVKRLRRILIVVAGGYLVARYREKKLVENEARHAELHGLDR